MRLKVFSILFCTLVLTACGQGPIVTVCLSDPKAGGFQCRDHDQKAFFKEYKDSENMVATTPEDFKKLLEWIKRHNNK